jgi:hypothetical protein
VENEEVIKIFIKNSKIVKTDGLNNETSRVLEFTNFKEAVKDVELYVIANLELYGKKYYKDKIILVDDLGTRIIDLKEEIS